MLGWVLDFVFRLTFFVASAYVGLLVVWCEGFLEAWVVVEDWLGVEIVVTL